MSSIVNTRIIKIANGTQATSSDRFKRLTQNGVILNMEKSVLGLEVVTFLGYHLEPSRSVSPPFARGLRRFLGTVNFYRRFLPHAATQQAVLQTAMFGLCGSQRVPWTPEYAAAFENCKSSLADATLLAHPDPTAQLGLFTNASQGGVGTTLQQRVDGMWQPLGFFSKWLTP